MQKIKETKILHNKIDYNIEEDDSSYEEDEEKRVIKSIKYVKQVLKKAAEKNGIFGLKGG